MFTVFLFVRCFIHSCLALSQALHLLRFSSLTSVVLDVLVTHMYMHTLYAVYAHFNILPQCMGKYAPAVRRSSVCPNYFMGVVSRCPFYRDSFALKSRIGSISFVRCPELRSVRFSELGFVLKL